MCVPYCFLSALVDSSEFPSAGAVALGSLAAAVLARLEAARRLPMELALDRSSKGIFAHRARLAARKFEGGSCRLGLRPRTASAAAAAASSKCYAAEPRHPGRRSALRRVEAATSMKRMAVESDPGLRARLKQVAARALRPVHGQMKTVQFTILIPLVHGLPLHRGTSGTAMTTPCKPLLGRRRRSAAHEEAPMEQPLLPLPLGLGTLARAAAQVTAVVT